MIRHFFSAQFLLWPMLFLVLVRDGAVRWGAWVVSVLTIAYLAIWTGLFNWPAVWFSIVIARNMLMFLLIIRLALASVPPKVRITAE